MSSSSALISAACESRDRTHLHRRALHHRRPSAPLHPAARRRQFGVAHNIGSEVEIAAVAMFSAGFHAAPLAVGGVQQRFGAIYHVLHVREPRQ
jgi:hypothetical protein